MTSGGNAAYGAARTCDSPADRAAVASTPGRMSMRCARRISWVWVAAAVVLVIPPASFVLMAAVLGAGMTGSSKAPLWVLLTVLVVALVFALMCGLGVGLAIGLAYLLARSGAVRPIRAAIVGAVVGGAAPILALIRLNALWTG